MECVSGPSMSILWNGEKTESFKPLRGLRQGDLLSPYLFVLCMERLCHLIDEAVEDKKWKPIRLSRGGPKLSHICFADDLIRFAEASVSQIRVIRSVLEMFCSASGQKVSLSKSKIFFSKNVARERGEQISRESGIASTRELGKILGDANITEKNKQRHLRGGPPESCFKVSRLEEANSKPCWKGNSDQGGAIIYTGTSDEYNLLAC